MVATFLFRVNPTRGGIDFALNSRFSL
jgi:hypothetical protein